MLDAAQHLIQQVGHPFVVKLHLDDLAEVGIHELHHYVTLEGRGGETGCQVTAGGLIVLSVVRYYS